jgi:hypothetical protein
MKQADLPLTASPVPKVVRLTLTPGQVEQLAPIAILSGLDRKNVLFIASIVPFWLPGQDEAAWELHVVKIPTTTGSKIARLIRNSQNNFPRPRH